MSYDESKVAFIDIETTGLDPEWHKVWEVAAIVDGVEHVWQQRIPGWCGCSYSACESRASVVAPWVLDNTGILDRYDPESALSPADSIDQFVTLVGGRHLVGACPWFDSERLQRVNLAEYGAESGNRDLPWHYHLIDVENLAVGFLRAAAQQRGWLHIPAELEEQRSKAMASIAESLDLPDGLGVTWVIANTVIVSRTNPPPWEALPWGSTGLSLALGVDPADFQPKHSALADARWAKAMYEAMMGGPA